MEREERKSKRTFALRPIEYFLAPSIIEKAYEGVMTDISDSGFCLLTKYPLKDRQRIITLDKSRLFENAAIVRWSQKYDDTLYKIGLEFLEDQAFMSIKDKRRYKRLNIKDLNIHGKIEFVHYMKILDLSLGGVLIETDKKWNVDEEYTLHLEYEGKQWPIKGYIVWSIVKECSKNGKAVSVYRAGMKLTSALNEIREPLRFIRQRLPRGYKNEFFSSNLDEAEIREKDMHIEKR